MSVKSTTANVDELQNREGKNECSSIEHSSGKRSISSLFNVLTPAEGEELKKNVKELRERQNEERQPRSRIK